MGDEKNRAAQVTAAAAKAVSKMSDPAKRAKAQAVLGEMRRRTADLQRGRSASAVKRERGREADIER